MNPVLVPTDPEKRMKLWHGMLERVKAEMKSGDMADWGVAPNFTGYAIHETDEKGALAATSSWAPFIIVDTFEPILTPDQALEAMKRFAAKK